MKLHIEKFHYSLKNYQIYSILTSTSRYNIEIYLNEIEIYKR